MASNLANCRRKSLSRSCQACIRAKHRCTRQLPKCNRCSKGALPCQYNNLPLSSKAYGAESAAKDLFIAAGSDLAKHQSLYEEDISDDIAFLLGARLFRKSHPSYPSIHSPLPNTCMRLNAAAHGIDLTLDYATLTFLVGHLKSYPAIFAESHATPFIHAQLYRKRMPKPIRDAWVLCNAHTSLNADDSASCWSVIDSKLSLLDQGGPRGMPLHLGLASCHALILYLILSIFHRSQRQYPPAVSLMTHLELLRDWTIQLWEIAPASIVTMQGSEWETWAMSESVRRTILTSYVLQGVFNVLSSGITRHTLFVSSLPFDARTWLWDVGDEAQWTQKTATPIEGLETLASYREFTDAWHTHNIPIHGTFEALLVAACKGRMAMISRE